MKDGGGMAYRYVCQSTCQDMLGNNVAIRNGASWQAILPSMFESEGYGRTGEVILV